jgi:hypothetical protein
MAMRAPILMTCLMSLVSCEASPPDAIRVAEPPAVETQAPPAPARQPRPAPDRRPIGMIWTGPGAGGWPVEQIERNGGRQVSTRPWKRYMWHMPASWKSGQVMSGAQWFTLTPERRAAFQALNRKCDAMGREFYVYGGIYMGKATDLGFADPAKPRINDFHDPADRHEMWQLVIKPWRDAGCDGWAFDAGSPAANQRSSLAWCKWLREEHGMWAAIEAFPLACAPGARGAVECRIDDKVALQVPSIAEYGYNPSMPEWTAPPGSEMYVWLEARAGPHGYEPTVTSDQVADLLRRNFIPCPDEAHDKITIEGYARAGMPIP